ncbi:hypothetical protein [Archangium violaceum]|uniref:Uncharacterized protein n=1 Tax=Archangium violaceum Cb vi76 TaxID=1406225 RepID=A0A084SWS4_9BACT|nr:hypothetical protein [Archangium violaceum]KFA92909.1 hypothetical protein Q664_12345 [Archangium violaceum Cb vi76]
MEFVLSFLTRERLTPEERALLERVRELTGTFGTYILEADSRDDLVARVDAVLEDPQFYTAYQGAFAVYSVEHFPTIVAELEEITDEDVANLGFAQALGPAAVPSLRHLHRHLLETSRCISRMFAGTTAMPAFSVPSIVSDDPLAFVSAPDVPPPVAEALLAGLRLNPLSLAVGALRFQQRTAERWLGLAIAELLARESRRVLAFMTALTGTEVPAGILPPEERLDLRGLLKSAQAVQEAYVRFNEAAKRSGEPIFPASS